MQHAFEPTNSNELVDQLGARMANLCAITITWLRCLSEFAQEHPDATDAQRDAAMLTMSRNLGAMVMEIHPTVSVAYADLEAMVKHFNLRNVEPLTTEVLQ